MRASVCAWRRALLCAAARFLRGAGAPATCFWRFAFTNAGGLPRRRQLRLQLDDVRQATAQLLPSIRDSPPQSLDFLLQNHDRIMPHLVKGKR